MNGELTNSEEVYWSINKLEREVQQIRSKASELFDYADEMLEYFKQLKMEVFDLVQEDKEAEPRKCSVYYILNEDKDMIKIGISGNVKQRIENMQTSTGYYLELLKEIEFDSREEALEAEAYLHDQFSAFRRKPNKIHKSSEWFSARIKDKLLRLYDSKEVISLAVKTHKEQMQKEMERIKIQI